MPAGTRWIDVRHSAHRLQLVVEIFCRQGIVIPERLADLVIDQGFAGCRPAFASKTNGA
ncbi:hypothetical protein [Bradyrhizobium sp. ORS 86]|uniref:hypothetical protein n=1 Tax=unclassified Bradyrhizobium TaxID=2631580 RepID=UPI00388D6751